MLIVLGARQQNRDMKCRFGMVPIRAPVGAGISPVERRPHCVLLRAAQDPLEHFFFLTSVKGLANPTIFR